MEEKEDALGAIEDDEQIGKGVAEVFGDVEEKHQPAYAKVEDQQNETEGLFGEIEKWVGVGQRFRGESGDESVSTDQVDENENEEQGVGDDGQADWNQIWEK